LAQVGVFLVIVLAGLFVFFGALYFQHSSFGRRPPPLLFLFAPVLLVPVIYLGVSWMFSLPLVMDKGLNFWPAMELSRKVVSLHWWTFFALLLVGSLLLLCGVLACFVGIL